MKTPVPAQSPITEPTLFAQFPDWQSIVRREPQVRYPLADMPQGAVTKRFRDCATTERLSDAREEIYSETPADMCPVWVILRDGASAMFVESLCIQMAIDGRWTSRKPLPR